MEVEKTQMSVTTPDGEMPAFLFSPAGQGKKPAVVLLMEAFGLTPHILDVATRIAKEGYIVLTPDLYYRELPDNKFTYEEVEEAMKMMYRMDFGQPVEADLEAAIAFVRSQPDVLPERVGVTGFCLGGGLTFLAACKFSEKIAAAASFYGMVLDEWVEVVSDITVPVYLFYGGRDPFIPAERVQQIKSRFRELDKEYKLKVYPEADHGFFCHERSSYNRSAAEDSWQELTGFFREYLHRLL
ncbi:MAG: Carboxymethylenebutenolidase (plasmid) [Chroococcopsis gigantea SAG 12.99]|jgi:dienelactone hydrolase|nr:Carboxymethylenebutenolidase [Chroococcopsis gigantea SAG 12.99]